jgi:hypothetical protein
MRCNHPHVLASGFVSTEVPAFEIGHVSLQRRFSGTLVLIKSTTGFCPADGCRYSTSIAQMTAIRPRHPFAPERHVLQCGRLIFPRNRVTRSGGDPTDGISARTT